jgi:hypothetical protein
MTRLQPELLITSLILSGCCCTHDDPPRDTDTTTEASPAPDGCGDGTWGDLPADDTTIFVDIAAGAAGDGSMEAPFTSIQDGLDAASGTGEGTIVAVAAGTYPEIVLLGAEHQGLHLAGRCQDMVVLDASVGDGTKAGVDVDLPDGSVALSGVTIQDATWAGVLVRGGELRVSDSRVLRSGFGGVVSMQVAEAPSALVMDGCELAENTGISVVTQNHGSVTLIDTVVRDTALMNSGGILVGIGAQAYTGGALVLDGATLSGHTGVSISAGDPGTTLTMSDSSIEGTALDTTEAGGYAIDLLAGASLVAEGCLFAENMQTALHVTSEGTVATLRGCEIRHTRSGGDPDSTNAIAIADGAVVTIDDCLIHDNEGPGALVVGGSLILEGSDVYGNVSGGVLARGGSSLTVVDSNIGDGRTNHEGLGGAGAYVYEGSIAEIRDCLFDNNRSVGLFANGEGTRVTLTDSTFQGTQPDDHSKFGYALLVTQGASVVVEGCDLNDNTEATVVTGTFDGIAGPELTLLDTLVRGTRSANSGEGGIGLSAQVGATVVAEDCTLTDNAAMGASVTQDGSRLVMRRSTVQDTRVDAFDRYGYGVQVWEGGTLEAEELEIIDSTNVGLLVVDAGSSASVLGGSITGSWRNGDVTVALGAAAQQGGRLEADGVDISGNEGPGLYGIDSGTSIRCDGCTLQGNHYAGAVVLGGASLELVGATISDIQPSENIGGGVGVHAATHEDVSPTLTLTSNTIHDNPIAGVQMMGAGRYQLDGNTIHGGTGWTRSGYTRCGDAVSAMGGVQAWDGATGLRIGDNEIAQGQGAGLFLQDSTASLEGALWYDNAVDLVSQGRDCEQPPEGFEDEPLGAWELCPTYDYGTCEDSFALYLEVAEVEPGYDQVDSGAAPITPPLALPRPHQASPRRTAAVPFPLASERPLR